MTSKDATIYFSQAIQILEEYQKTSHRARHPARLHFELSWTETGYDYFSKRFNLQESNENISMMTLRGVTDVSNFLDYLAPTFDEALERWSILKYKHEHRIETGNPSHFCDIQDVITFYAELARGNTVERVELAVIEHF
jgi:hypothetical protein